MVRRQVPVVVDREVSVYERVEIEVGVVPGTAEPSRVVGRHGVDERLRVLEHAPALDRLEGFADRMRGESHTSRRSYKVTVAIPKQAARSTPVREWERTKAGAHGVVGMGLLDGIREILGVRAERDATRDADPEDLFGMSTAYLTMQADLGYDAVEEAALCFAGVDSTDFEDTVEEVIDILEAGEKETGTTAELHTDDHGYQWVVLFDDDYEDLVTSMHFATDTFIERDYGSRLLAAVFGFRKGDGSASRRRGGGPADRGRVYWVYSFRRGAYYPFAPRPGNERDSSAEFKLESVLDGELEIEGDKEYWYPLWPNERGAHPWD